MSNIFQPTSVTYITAQDVKDSTTKTSLQALTDAQVEELIYKAENLVDGYIITYGTPFDETQSTIFPVIDSDGNSFLPQDITIGTFYIVEQIYESGDLISGATSSSAGSGAVKTEKVGDRTITYDVGSSSTTTSNTLKFLGIPPEAKAILDKYRKVFYRVKI